MWTTKLREGFAVSGVNKKVFFLWSMICENIHDDFFKAEIYKFKNKRGDTEGLTAKT